jgi:autotransporter passenger strand-loop-strand repeat protein
LIVSLGGVASGTVVTNAAVEVASSGGLAISSTVNGTGPVTLSNTDARQVVSEGGIASATTVLGGRITVSSGGQSVAAVVSGGAEIVDAGGLSVSTTLQSGGSETVLSGGVASASVVASGGLLTVSAGGSGTATAVFGGGTEIIAGGTESGGTVGAGGKLLISAGAAAATSVFGSAVVLGGSAAATAVFAGGALFVSSGGTTSGSTIFGGVEVVFAGGATFGTTVANATQIVSGGVASGTTVTSGGLEFVEAGGTAVNTTVSGARLELAAGGFAGGTIALAGVGDILQLDGTATPDAVIVGLNADDTIDLRGLAFGSGSAILDPVTHLLTVTQGGGIVQLQLDQAQDFSGTGFATFADASGGTAVSLFTAGNTIGPGQTLVLSAGQVVSGITVLSGGTLIVGSGAIASGTTIQNGGKEIVNGGGLDVGSTVASGGFQDVFGTASGTKIVVGGSQTVEVAGNAIGTILDDFGLQDVFGFAGGTVISATNIQQVEAGGTASGTVISAAGLEIVFASGLTNNTTIDTGGELQVVSGGLVSGFVDFAGVGGLLQLQGSSLPDGFTITGFAQGDLIDLPGLSGGSLSFNQVTGTLTISGSFVDTLQFSGIASGVGFRLVSDGAGGMFITEVTDTTAPVTTPISHGFRWNGGVAPIGIPAPSDPDDPPEALAIAITGLPANGAVTLADGVTPVGLGQTLTVAQLVGLEFAPGVKQTGTTGAFTYTATDLAGNTGAGIASLGVVPSPSSTLFDFVFTYDSGGDYYFGTVADNGTFAYQLGQAIPVAAGQYFIFNSEGATQRAAGTVAVTFYSHNGPGAVSYTPTKTASGLPSGTQGLGSESDAVPGVDAVLHPFTDASPAAFPTSTLFGFVYTYADGRAYYTGSVADDGRFGTTEGSRQITNGGGALIGSYSVFALGQTTRSAGTVSIDQIVIGGAGLQAQHSLPGGVDGVNGLGSESALVVLNGGVFTFSSRVEPTLAGSPVPLTPFDPAFYLSRYPDIAQAGVDPAFHYHILGWREGRDPNAYFSTSGYLNSNPDVKAAGIDPLEHYHLYGWKEGRDPGLNFDNEFYLAHNPDVRAAGSDPLLHYLQFGKSEGRQIAPAVGSPQLAANGFDREFYLMKNPDVASAGLDPQQHFLNRGATEGRDPNA